MGFLTTSTHQSRSGDARRTLITGGAGFIGSHLAESLLHDGHEVFVLDDLSTGRLENVQQLVANPRFHLIVDSVMHHAVTNELIHKCDEVYHLAASVGVQLVVDKPVHTITTNIRGTEIVLDLCGRFGKRLLIASTSEVYGDRRELVAFAEHDRRVYGPTTASRWGYAASKEIDEFLALAWHREHGLDVVIARLFNTIGTRQRGRYGMVVPRFVDAALTGQPLVVYGTGDQTRCFCDVRDAVPGLVGLMRCDEAMGGIFNVGSDDSITINTLAELIRELSESASKITHVPYEAVYGEDFEDMLHRRPSLVKIASVIGWRPEIDLRTTLNHVIDRRSATLNSGGSQPSEAITGAPRADGPF